MELESLKYIWHNLPTPPASDPDTVILLQKRSKGPVARMRRNLRRELILIILTYIPGILFYWIDFDGRLSEIGWLLVLLLSVFGGYYYRKNKLLQEMECVQCEVRSNLQGQVQTLQKYVRFYLLAGTLMIPVTAILAWLIIQWKLPSPPGFALGDHPSWWTRPLFWLIMLVPFTIGLYYINAWYVNKLYGRHIKKLQELLQEMNEE